MQLPKSMFLTRVQYNFKQLVFKFTKKTGEEFCVYKNTYFYIFPHFFQVFMLSVIHSQLQLTCHFHFPALSLSSAP